MKSINPQIQELNKPRAQETRKYRYIRIKGLKSTKKGKCNKQLGLGGRHIIDKGTK